MKKGSWMIVFEWIWRVVSLNLCWIAFTILGLGIFGFFPSSVALFTIVRRWLKKDTDLHVWKTFKQVYFSEWKRSNGIGLVFYCIGLFLFIDIRIVTGIMTGIFSIFLLVFLYFVAFLLLLSIGYFFALYVHYELSNKEYIKQSFLYAATGFTSTLWIGAGLFIVLVLIYKVPGLILFISGVAPAYWMMRVCINRFSLLEKRLNQHI
ncbi:MULTISPECIES: YesL family protein [Heyndrickxia]|uniref:YesL family protein n=1 Tax=Heyndrickxia TaxID=2837504 RepID=UPI001B242924|nr:YesL family protein [Heyndrickxia oleronia]GIN41850.1 membrane protein [Heyndrickxia oleronia]